MPLCAVSCGAREGKKSMQEYRHHSHYAFESNLSECFVLDGTLWSLSCGIGVHTFVAYLIFFTLMMKKSVWRRGEWWFMYCSRLLRGHPSRLSFLRIWKMHRKCVNLTASQYRKSWIFWGIFCGKEVEITTTYPNKNYLPISPKILRPGIAMV